MKSHLALLFFCLFSFNMIAQNFETGTIITKRYDTLKNVQIEKLSEAKSLKHITYIDENGETQKPAIETIKCYKRGNEKFLRIYYDCDMVLVKQLVEGRKVNLYAKSHDGTTTYYIEKVYDELIKVPSSKGKFAKVVSTFLKDDTTLSKKIKAKELNNIEEIVDEYNKS